MKIPVLSISAYNLPSAWERAVIAVWDKGLEFIGYLR